MPIKKVKTEEIFNKLNEEKKTGELLPLPEDFYNNIENNEAEGLGQDSERLVENRKRIYDLLRTRRLQKILTYLAYGKKLPHPVPSEEERIYIRLKEIIEEQNSVHKTTKIKVMVSAPEIMTTGGRKIGPFEKNTVLDVDSQEDLEFLIKNKIGELISP